MRYLFVLFTALLLGFSFVACDDPSTTPEPNPPTDPAEPTEPNEPSEPNEPNEPSEPTEPDEPSDPSDPTNPDDPSDPTEPGDPDDPDPTDPTDPTDPDPTDPTEPTEPTDSTGQLVLAFSPSSATVTIVDVATTQAVSLADAFESSSLDPDTDVRTDTYNLNVGLYEIQLSAQGYSDYRVQESIEEDESATLNATLNYTVANAPLSLSADGRGLLSGGAPFLWMGDTAWALFSATTNNDALLYLDDAKAKGFNVVQVFLDTIWTDNGDNAENKFGEAPFIDNDPTQLNPKYFDYVEWVVNEAGRRGLYVAIMYGGPGRGSDGRIPYRLESVEEAYAYANAVGQRLSSQTLRNNIIWINGQDWAPHRDLAFPLWRKMAEGLADGVNSVVTDDGSADYSSTFQSFHTDGCCSSSDHFNDSAWLDFNAINTWKRYFNIVKILRDDYSLTPVKPTVCVENTYEDHAYDGEYRDEWYVRFQSYWCMFSGAAGYAYGHKDGYKLTEAAEWPTVLNKPGRLDMKHLKSLLTAYPFDSLEPAQDMIVSGEGSARLEKTYVAATRSTTNTYALVYSTQGGNFSLDLTVLMGDTLKTQWFDPREGTYQDAGTVTKGSSVAFDPPGTSGEGNDWVLVVETQP